MHEQWIKSNVLRGKGALNFSLTKQHEAVREAARILTEEVILPGVAHLDRVFPEILKTLAKQRMMGMTAPREYGGGGMDEVGHVLTLMELSRGSASVAAFLAWNNGLYCFSLLEYGTEGQKRAYLPPCAGGEKTGSFALIESPLSGMDRLTVVAAGEEGFVSGRGVFLPRGVSCGIVPALFHETGERVFLLVDQERAEGLRREERLAGGGIFFFGLEEAIFDNGRIGADCLLGRGDGENDRLQRVLQEAWTCVGALAVGIGAGALKEAVDFAGTQRGRGALSQCMEWKLADMAVDVEAARLLVLKAAWLKDRGKSYEREAAGAKVFSAASAVRASCESLAILGGRNPGARPLLERRVRDAEMCRDYYGTIEEAGFCVADHVLGRARMTIF